MDDLSPSRVIETLATELVSFLDLDIVVALAHTNRSLRQSIWCNDEVWKIIVLSQFSIFVEQEQELKNARFADPLGSQDAIQPSCSWRNMALSLNNVMKGRYTTVKLDLSGEFDDEDEDWVDSASSDDENGSDNDDSLDSGFESETMSFTNDEAPTEEDPYYIVIDGVKVSKHKRVNFGEQMIWSSEPHRWWAETLYYYLSSTENCPFPSHLRPWMRFHDNEPFVSYSPWRHADPRRVTRDGLLICCPVDSEMGDPLIVSDLLHSNDEILHSFEDVNIFEQGDQLGTDTDLIVVRNFETCTLYYDLRGTLKTIQVFDSSWEQVHGNYGWSSKVGGIGCLQFLDRPNSRVMTVYESSNIFFDVVCLLQTDSEDPVEGRIVRPESQGKIRRTRGALSAIEDLSTNGILVAGRILVLAVNFRNRFYICFMDMRKDCLLYAVYGGVNHGYPPWQLNQGIFRGQLLSLRLLQFNQSGVFNTGVFFTPFMPTLDEVHKRLFDFMVAMEQSDRPITKHPSFRISLHELVKANNERLCDSTEQQFLLRLYYEFYRRDLYCHPMTQVVCCGVDGEPNGKKFCSSDLETNPLWLR